MLIFKNNKGLTLLEFLVALSIIMLLSTIALPYLRKYQPNLKLHATARDLITDIRYAQQLTVTEQKVHLVKLDAINNKYEIIKIDTASSTVKTVNLNPDITFKEIINLTDNQIVFNFYGGVSESGWLTLTNAFNTLSTINIRPSGYAQLSE